MKRRPSARARLPASRSAGPPSTATINRAPVLTLWAAVVAERLGFTRPEALSLGKALAGLNAQPNRTQNPSY